MYLDVLRLFAHGTWGDYKCSNQPLECFQYICASATLSYFFFLFYQRIPLGNASRIPQLSPDQILKLKQLTVLTLAESNKVLPYDTLMVELDVTNVRELEDFLINDCMYAVSALISKHLFFFQFTSMLVILTLLYNLPGYS